jgi:hypothetical protein
VGGPKTSRRRAAGSSGRAHHLALPCLRDPKSSRLTLMGRSYQLRLLETATIGLRFLANTMEGAERWVMITAMERAVIRLGSESRMLQ